MMTDFRDPMVAPTGRFPEALVPRLSQPARTQFHCLMGCGACRRWSRVEERVRGLFSFPNPANEVTARVVAGGVVVICVAIVSFGQPWLLIPLCYGFWARVLTGPTMSPLAMLASRVVAPRLAAPRPVPGPPKRFAQAMGVAFSTTAVILWFGFGQSTPALGVIAALTAAAVAECVFGLCLGCKIFTLLMRVGLIPNEVCATCADITVRYPQLREPVGV
jgi:Domain of unknown function (DUF4395)